MSGNNDREAAEKFLKEQFDKIDPTVREKKMTFREATKIIREFADDDNYPGDMFLLDLDSTGGGTPIKILEAANYDVEKAAKIYRTYVWIDGGCNEKGYDDNQYLDYTP